MKKVANDTAAAGPLLHSITDIVTIIQLPTYYCGFNSDCSESGKCSQTLGCLSAGYFAIC